MDRPTQQYTTLEKYISFELGHQTVRHILHTLLQHRFRQHREEKRIDMQNNKEKHQQNYLQLQGYSFRLQLQTH
jgi:hypothetical protein